MNSIPSGQFTAALLLLLEESFETVHGIYLDRNTTFFETLSGITAGQASIPVGKKCATLAAQVKHTAFYLDVISQSLREGKFPEVDWEEIWKSVTTVTEAEWLALQTDLHASYQHIKALFINMQTWPGEREITSALGIIAHSAYHLGEIRQALCTLIE